MNNSIDIVICVSLKDCYFLNKNFYFIFKNLSPSTIYIITDPRNFKYIQLQKSIVLIDENKLIDGLNMSVIKEALNNHCHNDKAYGWYFQQLLKLAFSQSQYAKKCYLIWDSDTVALNPLTFIDGDKYNILPKSENHKPYFETIERLLKLPIIATHSFISEHMIIDTEIMKSMLLNIEQSSFYKYSSNEKWFEKCIYATDPEVIQGFSEFETYGNFCLNFHPNIMKFRWLRSFRHGSKIFSVFGSRKEIESLKDELDIISFELYDYPVDFFRKYKQAIFFKICKAILFFRLKIKNFPF
ncbi:DUF6492 family protein [Aquirufa regiilacus]|uniref:DUF6492 family protein n=1 Tax=Aquirufa regiilacus TaxID=3024868 RepID=A0ABU3TSS1_9BACT|nr:DUF6492 family protein [Aquirufa sp. LEOWEIH-7C]MDU0808903.1 DUF6492 family protein [Aquirufa sp. LEOWEIH-7C]